MTRRLVPALLVLVATAGASAPVAAQSVYAGVGSTGVFAGYGHRFGPSLGARAELAWLPAVSRSFTEDGIAYTGEARSLRGTALADWHPFGGVFRISVGLSGVDASGAFVGTPATGSSITIGGSVVPVGPADRYDVTVRLPSAMPYLGIGWGHSVARGWGVHADLGVLFGAPTVTGTLSPSLRAKIAATGRDPDAELERELQAVRETAAKFDLVPVVSIGVGYRW